MKRFGASLLAAMGGAALVGGCGGGGSGGSGSGPVVIAPTPTPTPTPTPPPVIYASGFDFTTNLFANSSYVELRYNRLWTIEGHADSDTRAEFVATPQAILTWNPETRASIVRIGGVPTTYPASSISIEVDGGKQFYFREGENSFMLTWAASAMPANVQTLGAVWEERNACVSVAAGNRCAVTLRMFLTGGITLLSEIPLTGMRAYTSFITMQTSEEARLSLAESLEVAIDLGAGTIRDSRNLAPSGVRLNGTINRDLNAPLRGSFTIEKTGVTGTFVGEFRGAQGREFGLLLRGQGPDGTPVIGRLTGFRAP